MPGINLEKNLDEGSLRWIGRQFNGLPPQELVIAGNSLEMICDRLQFDGYRIGRAKTENVFLAYREPLFYIYVAPTYAGYRKRFEQVVGKLPKNHQVDHILARNTAQHFNYQYVLLCAIPQKANVSHGWVEKKKVPTDQVGTIPDICMADDRIFDKILSRYPNSRKRGNEQLGGYRPHSTPNYGLTLKQKGMWNSAFGFHRVSKGAIRENTTLFYQVDPPRIP